MPIHNRGTAELNTLYKQGQALFGSLLVTKLVFAIEIIAFTPDEQTSTWLPVATNSPQNSVILNILNRNLAEHDTTQIATRSIRSSLKNRNLYRSTKPQ